MTKTTMLKIVNPLLLLLVLTQGVTGMFRDQLGLDEAKFELFHVYTGLLLVALALVHLALNWSWIKSQFGRKHPKAPQSPSTK